MSGSRLGGDGARAVLMVRAQDARREVAPSHSPAACQGVTSVLVIALPPISQPPLSAYSTRQRVTWRRFSPSIETSVSVSLLMI